MFYVNYCLLRRNNSTNYIIC